MFYVFYAHSYVDQIQSGCDRLSTFDNFLPESMTSYLYLLL